MCHQENSSEAYTHTYVPVNVISTDNKVQNEFCRNIKYVITFVTSGINNEAHVNKGKSCAFQYRSWCVLSVRARAAACVGRWAEACTSYANEVGSNNQKSSRNWWGVPNARTDVDAYQPALIKRLHSSVIRNIGSSVSLMFSTLWISIRRITQFCWVGVVV